MHLRSVEIFCEVVHQRSFSKAAETFNVSQSSASQAVQMLEDRLGTQLIDRSQRPLEMTPAGQVYFDGCRELLETYHTIEDRVHRLQDKVVGPVRVAAIYSVGLLQMGVYVRQFERLYPETDLRVEYFQPDQVYESVLQDEADLGLLSFPREGGDLSSIPWQEQELALVTAPGHHLAERESVSVAELQGEDFVAFTPELTIRKMIARWLKEQKVSVRVVHTFDNMENIKRAIEIGSGVSLLPVPAVRREVVLGSLAAVPLNDVTWYRPLGIIHKRHKVFSNAVSKFIELLHEDPESFPNGDSPTTDAVIEQVGMTS